VLDVDRGKQCSPTVVGVLLGRDDQPTAQVFAGFDVSEGWYSVELKGLVFWMVCCLAEVAPRAGIAAAMVLHDVPVSQSLSNSRKPVTLAP